MRYSGIKLDPVGSHDTDPFEDLNPFIVLTGTPEECGKEWSKLREEAKKEGAYYYTNGSEWINKHEIRMCLFLEEK